jgi:hypothetical protein
LLALAEHSWHDRLRLRAGVLAVLGLAAAIISRSVVLERVSSTQEARLQSTRSGNLPRVEAQMAVTEAKEALAAAKFECSSGRGRRSDALEQREQQPGNGRPKPAPSWFVSVRIPLRTQQQGVSPPCCRCPRQSTDWYSR